MITKPFTDSDAAHPCIQGSFCAWVGPMRDDDTLKRHLSLSGPMYGVVPGALLRSSTQSSTGNLNQIISSIYDITRNYMLIIFCFMQVVNNMHYFISFAVFADSCCRLGTASKEIHWLFVEYLSWICIDLFFSSLIIDAFHFFICLCLVYEGHQTGTVHSIYCTKEMPLADVVGSWSWSLGIETSLWVGRANEGRHCVEMLSLIGWAHAHGDPWSAVITGWRRRHGDLKLVFF